MTGGVAEWHGHTTAGVSVRRAPDAGVDPVAERLHGVLAVEVGVLLFALLMLVTIRPPAAHESDGARAAGAEAQAHPATAR